MSAGEVREVPISEAFGEAQAESGPIDQKSQPRPRPQRPAENQEPVSEPEQSQPSPQDDIDMLSPMTEAREWTLGKGEIQRTYIQRELSVIGKVQWFSLVGEVLDKALSGDNALSLNTILQPPQIDQGQPVVQQFQDADTFVHAVGKLLTYSPDFLTKSICIWLDVPDYEHDLVDMLMKRSPTEGGLSDDDFEQIFSTFIDQNYESMERFFGERFPRLRARLQAQRKKTRDRSPFRKR